MVVFYLLGETVILFLTCTVLGTNGGVFAFDGITETIGTRSQVWGTGGVRFRNPCNKNKDIIENTKAHDLLCVKKSKG